MTLSGAWWNLPKRPGVKAKGLVDFFSQTEGIWHSVSCLLLLNFFGYLFPAITYSYLQEILLFIIILKRMYAIYKQTHLPIGIEHCVYCQFFSPAENNRVVAGTSQLRIYKFYTQDEVGVGLRESFYGDFSCCIIENILLEYQVQTNTLLIT